MPAPMLEIGLLAGGIVLLIFGGDLLVRGAVTMAVRAGVSALIVGLTVVAFGTSAPELAFNVIAALNDNSDLAFGNIIGSNIANIGLVLGVAAIIQPMAVHASVIRRELPVMIVITAAATYLALAPKPSSGWLGAGEGLVRTDGLILLGLFGVFLVLTYLSARREQARRRTAEAGGTFVEEMEEISAKDRERSMGRAILFFVAGLGLLLAGGKLAEQGAVGLAESLGVSDRVIGLTIVAIATSLPELFVAVIAAMKKQADIAVGNVVGSNIFNLGLVMGSTATVGHVVLPAHGTESLVVMGVLSILLLLVARTGGQSLSRFEGSLLLVLYTGFMGYTVVVETTGG